MDLEQDTNQIYNAFVAAGLGPEARQMSTQKKVRGTLRIVPGIGRYITIADRIHKKGEPVSEFYSEAKKKILAYVGSLEGAYSKETEQLDILKSKLNELLE